MRIETGLVAYLQTKTAITTVVGTRVFPKKVPDKLLPNRSTNYPAITYDVISATGNHSMLGSTQLCYKRFQITAWGLGEPGYHQSKDLAELLRLALDGYAGAMGSVTVQSCFKEGEQDAPLELSAGAEQQIVYGASQDYMIGYTEAVPTL